jgi:hypothetical protein
LLDCNNGNYVLCVDVIRRTVWSSKLVVELSAVLLSEVTWSSWLVSERVRLSAASWKSACEEKSTRFMWNGRQSGTQLVELSGWQEFCMGGYDKKT